MKLRIRRHHRTRPRLYRVSASLACRPYVVVFGDVEIPMDSRRVNLAFWMQDATHSDCFRKLSEIARVGVDGGTPG
jgi:hypothetical protein